MNRQRQAWDTRSFGIARQAISLFLLFLGISIAQAATIPVITSQPSHLGVIENESAELAISATGDDLDYQWYFNATNFIDGATNSIYSIPAVTPAETGLYHVVVNNPAGAKVSSLIRLSILTAPIITSEPQSQTNSQGATVSFLVNATGSGTHARLAWEPSPDPSVTGYFVYYGASSYIYSHKIDVGNVTNTVITNLTAANLWYFAVSAYNAAGIESDLSDEVSGSGAFTYNWFVNPLLPVPIPTSTGSVHKILLASPADNGSYYVVLNNHLGSTTSAVANLDIVGLPAFFRLPEDISVPLGSNLVLDVWAGGAEPLHYQWFHDSEPIPDVDFRSLNFTNISMQDAGEYYVIASNIFGVITSSVINVSVIARPNVLFGLQDRIDAIGGTATFLAIANGTAPLQYLWFHNGTNLIAVTGSGSFPVSNLTLDHSGSYHVVVTNAAGTSTSAVATLTVLVPPSITGQPQNVTAIQGSNVFFSVASAGSDPLSFQWLSNSVAILGATASTLNLNNVQASQQASYSVIVMNPGGNATSSVATLTVLIPPSISAQPQNATVNRGANASFTVSAGGTAPLSFQWFSNSVAITGATSTALNLTNLQVSATYRVAVSNVAGVVTSAVANLTVIQPPSITQQPQNSTANQGANASFTVTATGSAPLSFQWFSNSLAIAGATTSTLNLNNVQAGHATGYRVVITNSAGSVTSAIATLTLVVPPAITAQPQSTTANQGSSAGFSVTATGSDPLSFQWFSNSVAIAGANSANLNLNDLQAGHATGYRVVVTNSAGSVTSAIANLTVILRPAITAQPQNATANLGGNASFAVTATGSAPLSFQWFSNSVAIAGANTSTLNLDNLRSGHTAGYLVVITNAAGSVTSSVANLTVILPPAITAQPQNSTGNQGGNASFTVAVTGSAPLAFQWFSNSVAIAGATTSTLNLNNLQSGHAAGYHVVITNAAGSVTSTVANLTVILRPVITAQPQNAASALGGSASFSVTANGTGPLAFQWYSNSVALAGATASTLELNNIRVGHGVGYRVVITNTAGSVTSSIATLTVAGPPAIIQQPQNTTANFGSSTLLFVIATGSNPLSFQWFSNAVAITGANSSSLTLTNIQPAHAAGYHVIISNPGGSITSSVANLTVRLQPVITAQPQSLIAHENNNVSFTVGATGLGPLSFQWFSNSVAILGATSPTLNLNNVIGSHSGGYHVVVTNNAGSVTSSIANLTVIIPPSIIQQPQDTTVNLGSNAFIFVEAGGSNPLGFQWFSNSVAISGANSSTLDLTNVQPDHAAAYHVVITNSAGSITSSTASLLVIIPPGIALQPQNIIANQGSFASFTINVTGTAPLSFQWFSNSIAVAGANSATFNLINLQASHSANYHVVVTNAAGSVTSSVANLMVRVPPVITQHPQNITVSPGSIASFLVTATGTAPLSFQWFSNSVAIADANEPLLTLNNVHAGYAAAYHVVVTNAAGSATSQVAHLSVGVAPTILTHPESISAIATSNATFSVSVIGSGPLGFQWFFNTNTPLNFQTNSLLSLPSVSASNAGTYHVVVTNSGGSVTSQVAALSILRKIFSPVTQQGSFSFTILGSPGDSYSIEFSTNNEAWAELEIINNTSGSLTYTNIPAGQSRRYYRARLRN